MFAWDAGNIDHLARHTVSPQEAEEVIGNSPLILERQIRGAEKRILYLGETRTGRVLFVVVTPRKQLMRVVTAFPADKRARAFYATQRDTDHAEDAGDPEV